MNITVLIGTPLSGVIGYDRLTLAVDESTTVAGLIDELRARYPDFEAGLRGKGLDMSPTRVIYRLIVNNSFVPWEGAATTVLHEGDRVLLVMPISGG